MEQQQDASNQRWPASYQKSRRNKYQTASILFLSTTASPPCQRRIDCFNGLLAPSRLHSSLHYSTVLNTQSPTNTTVNRFCRLGRTCLLLKSVSRRLACMRGKEFAGFHCLITAFEASDFPPGPGLKQLAFRYAVRLSAGVQNQFFFNTKEPRPHQWPLAMHEVSLTYSIPNNLVLVRLLCMLLNATNTTA